MSPNVSVGREMSRASQERDREVESDDFSSAFGKGERVTPVATTDINDAGIRRKLEQRPEAAYLRPDLM